MGYANSSIKQKIETFISYANPWKNAFVSSTIVREIIRFNGKFQHLIPEKVFKCI